MIFATNACEVTTYSESWQKCFNIIMNNSKIPKLNIHLDNLIYDIVYKDEEWAEKYDEDYYNEFKKK